MGASLVVQWLRIHLPMQGTQVRALAREDPHATEQARAPQLQSLRSRSRAPQLPSLSSRARASQLLSLRATTTEARVPRAHAPQQEKPPQ